MHEDRATASYGCVRCQLRHYNDEPVYDAHIGFQSKHGVSHTVTPGEWEIVLEQRFARNLEGVHCCDCGEPLTAETAFRRPSEIDDVVELVHVTCALNRA